VPGDAAALPGLFDVAVSCLGGGTALVAATGGPEGAPDAGVSSTAPNLDLGDVVYGETYADRSLLLLNRGPTPLDLSVCGQGR
jgi:hypothetical protein